MPRAIPFVKSFLFINPNSGLVNGSYTHFKIALNVSFLHSECVLCFLSSCFGKL